jgi:hypothetical protein
MAELAWRGIWSKIMASLAVVLLIALSFGGNADNIGEEFTDKGLNRSLITFASARAINGLISVAQGTEVAIQPGGIGAVLTPGQILDPINDLVEQFSQVMLFSAAVLGTQKLLIEMSAWVWFSALLSSFLIFWVATLWLPDAFAPGTRRIALAISGLLLVLRFLVPLAATTNEAIFDRFLATGYEEANQHLEVTAKELDTEKKTTGTTEESKEVDDTLLGALAEFYESVKVKADVSAKLEELKDAANKTAEVIIDLIVLFMVQTLLLPLIFAWIGYSAIKRLARYALETPDEKDQDVSH